MPVRIVDGEPRLQPSNATKAAGTPRRKLWALSIAAVVVIAIMAVVVLNQPRSETTPTPAPTGVTSEPNTAPTPADSLTGADAIRPTHSNVIEPVTGAPGLWRGTATVASGYGDTFLGVPILWPHTVDGAIGAAINHSASMASLDNFRPATAVQLDGRLLTQGALGTHRTTDEWWQRTKAWYHLDEGGNPLNMDDQPSPELRLYMMGYPRYAAYQVTAVGADLSTVSVTLWMPASDGVGVGEDLSAVRLQWVKHAKVMKWEEGDWRVDAITTEQAPQGTERRPNLPWPQVRSLLGPGWSIPADATDQPYAGAVLAR